MNKLKLLPLFISASLLGSTGVQAENLLEIFQAASSNDPTLRASAATRDATKEARPQAKAKFLPQVSGSATLDSHHSSADYESQRISLSLTQSLFSKANLATLAQADQQVAQADADYQAAEQALITRVAEAYFAVLRAMDNVEFQRADKSAISRQLEQASKRYEVGLIAITDVHEAQARFDQAVAGQIDAENTLSSRLEDLREITSETYRTVNALGENIELNPPSPANMEDWVNAAIEQNLTLLAATYATTAAREGAEVQRAGHYPTLDLVASTFAAENASSATADSSDDTTIGLQLTVPIYTGGATSSLTRQAEYSYVATRENEEFTRRQVQADTRDAYRGIESAISRVNALAQVLLSSQSALDATEAGFEVGTRTIVDVLNAQRTLYGSERDLKSARYDYLLNTLRLKEAAGTLNVADLEQINSLLVP